MHLNNAVILIDADSRRRAGISHAMAANGRHVEPLESTSELAYQWPEAGILLVHDDGQVIEQINDLAMRHATWLPVIAYAEDPAPGRIVETVLAGAVDYLAWPFANDELSASFSRASQRAVSVGTQRLRAASARGRLGRLTRRERQVLSAMTQGLSNRGIAEQLAISPRTVEIHRSNMLGKLQASHTSEAIRLAIEADLVA